MSRRVEKDGKFFRMRRGKLVEIPFEWVGVVPASNHWRMSSKRFWVKYQNRQKRQALKTELRSELMSL